MIYPDLQKYSGGEEEKGVQEGGERRSSTPLPLPPRRVSQRAAGLVGKLFPILQNEDTKKSDKVELSWPDREERGRGWARMNLWAAAKEEFVR